MDDFTGRTAVVTGAARGIGRALAERFAAEGMSVVLADLSDPTEVASEIAAEYGVVAAAVPTDVTQFESVERLASTARERFGRVDVVCNNAGVLGRFRSVWETPEDEWRALFDVNVWGVINGVRAFVPLLVAQGEGHVVNTASAAAWLSLPGLGPYAATKHAVLAVSEALRLELEAAESGVGVSVLCPHVVRTGIVPDDEVGSNRAVRTAVKRAIDDGVAPSVIADAVVAGIKENRFMITEDPDTITTHADRRAAVARGAAPRFR